MHTMQNMMNKRMDMIELKIEQSESKVTDIIVNKINKTFDKRISSEMSKLKKEIDNKLSDLKKEFDGEIAELNLKLDRNVETTNTRTTYETRDLSLNIMVHGLPETANENISGKVDALIKDGLKVRDASMASAVRKSSRLD